MAPRGHCAGRARGVARRGCTCPVLYHRDRPRPLRDRDWRPRSCGRRRPGSRRRRRRAALPLCRPRRRVAREPIRRRCRAPRVRCCDNGGARRSRCAAVIGEQLLAVAGAAGTGLERRAVNDQRQRRVVRYAAVIGEKVLLNSPGVRGVRHGVRFFRIICGEPYKITWLTKKMPARFSGIPSDRRP